MVCIKQISFYDYLLGTKLTLPHIGTYYVRHSLTKDGVLIGAYIDEALIGIAVMEFALRPILTYVFVEENFRGKGIGAQLVKEVMTLAKGKHAEEVEAFVILKNEYGEAADYILMKTGYEMIDTATIIRYASDEKCNRTWALFMKEKGNRICSALAGHGFKTLPFSEVPSETFDRLKASIGREFPQNLNPFDYIQNQSDRIVMKYSFVTLKNDEPVAFVTVTTVDDKTLVFQQLSSAFRYQGRGAFLLPFVAFMEKFLTDAAYSKVSAVIFDKNDRMQRLVYSFIGSFAESMKTQNVYRCKL